MLSSIGHHSDADAARIRGLKQRLESNPDAAAGGLAVLPEETLMLSYITEAQR